MRRAHHGPCLCLRSSLTVIEVARLSGWPVSDREESFPGPAPEHPRPVRPSAALQTGERVSRTGEHARHSGDALGYSVTDALRHTWVIGPNGVGKSTLFLDLIVQDLEANRPVVVIEPKDLIADLLARIPATAVTTSSCSILSTKRRSASIRSTPEGRDRPPEVVADSLFGTFKAHLRRQPGTAQRRHFAQLPRCPGAPRRRVSGHAASAADQPRFRRKLTRFYPRRSVCRGFVRRWFDNLSPEATTTVVAPLSNKLRPLITAQLRAVLAQHYRRSFNIRQVLQTCKVLLVPLQKGVLGPEHARLLAALVDDRLRQAIRERAGVPEKDPPRRS